MKGREGRSEREGGKAREGCQTSGVTTVHTMQRNSRLATLENYLHWSSYLFNHPLQSLLLQAQENNSKRRKVTPELPHFCSLKL